MKKWVSLLLIGAWVLSLPVSAFATGVKGEVRVDGNVHLNLDDKHDGDQQNGQHEDGNHDNNDDGKDLHVGLVGDGKFDAKIIMDGKLEAAWDLAKEKIPFKDVKSGMEGNYWFTWDRDNLYCLVELKGAAKLWKDDKKSALLSLFFSGDGQDGKGEGYVALSWPDMTVHHDSTLNFGAFKPNLISKAFSAEGDDVTIELKLPWVEKEGAKLNADEKLGLCFGLAELDTKVDANGQVIVPEVTIKQILDLKPAILKVYELKLVGSLIDNGQQTVGGGGNTGGTDNTGGTGNIGGTASTGGTGSMGGTGSTGGTGNIGGTGSSGGTGNTGGTGSPGTAVGGVTDTGVIPGAMPQTGGGGASDWTD